MFYKMRTSTAALRVQPTIVFMLITCSFLGQTKALISLFNDCFGSNVVVTLTHPSSGEILYQETPPVGTIVYVDIQDAQTIQARFTIPHDNLEVSAVLADSSHVLLQDYLVVMKGHRPRVGMIGYLTDQKGVIMSTLFQLWSATEQWAFDQSSLYWTFKASSSIKRITWNC